MPLKSDRKHNEWSSFRILNAEVGVIYEVYIDVLAANNFFADLAALLAVNMFRKRNVRAYRILAGAVCAASGSCLAFLVSVSPAAYFLSVHFLINPAVLLFTFREKSKQDFFSDLCISYFAFLVIGGITEWLYAGGTGFVPYETAVCAALLLVPVFAVWFKRQQKNRIRFVDVCLGQAGKQLRLQALADSGNLLTDPYTGKPVSMIDRQVYESAYGTPCSVRLIPYESLGCRHGLLEAVTIEELNFVYGNDVRNIQKAVLGLADHALFDKKPYQMILNPQENPTGGMYEKDG